MEIQLVVNGNTQETFNVDMGDVTPQDRAFNEEVISLLLIHNVENTLGTLDSLDAVENTEDVEFLP